MLSYLIVVLSVVIVSFIFLGFNIFLRRKNFPETEIGRNKAMRDLGITCPKCDEMRIHRYPKQKEQINPGKFKLVH